MSDTNKNLSILIITCREDYAVAKKLTTDLKRYKIPRNLIGQANRDGKVSAKINQSYINLEQAFDPQSTYLDARYAIVLCSPEAAESIEVDQWVRAFKNKHSSSQVLCYILSGEPNAADRPDSGLQEAFPDSVKFLVDDQGELTNERTEPIAADSRKHADGIKNANLKLLAGIYAVRYEQLRQRAKKRKLQKMAVATILLSLLIAYVVNVAWQQRKEDIAKRQQQYESLAQQTFAALNSQSPQAMTLYRQTQINYDETLEDKGLLESLKFRLSHEKLEAKVISNDPEIQFLLKGREDKIGSVVYAVGFHQGVLIFIDETSKRYEFDITADRWSKGWHDGKSEIRAIELLDSKTVWLIVGNNKKWNMLRLNLSDLSIQRFAEQSTTLLRNIEYPGRFESFERNLNLKFGQAMVKSEGKIGIYDALTEKTYMSSFPDAINWDDVSYDITVDWHRDTQKVFVFDKNNAAYQWSYREEQAFRLFHAGTFNSKIVAAQSDWVIINETSDDFKYSSQIYHLTDGRHFKIENNHTIHVQDDLIPQLHLLLKGIDGSTKEEAYLDASSGAIISRRHIDWRLSASNNEGNRYYSDAGTLYRQSSDFIAGLNQWSINCDNNTGLQVMGEWQCLLDKKWIGYRVENHSKQWAKTLDGYIRKYIKSNVDDLWIISNQKAGMLSLWSISDSKLSRIKSNSGSEECYLNLHLAANNLAYVTTSKSKSAMFVGGPCTGQVPYSITAFQLAKPSQGELMQGEMETDNGIINLELTVGKGVFKPGYNIAGVYQDLTNLNWYARPNGEYYRHSDLIKSIELQENATPIYISRNPVSSELAVTEYIENKDEKTAFITLSFLDKQGTHKKTLIVSQLVTSDTLVKHMLHHGFSADGNWFWWANFGPEEIIHWVSLAGEQSSAQFPQNYNAALDYLLFSKSQKFMLFAAPYTTGVHKVYDVKKQTVVFESSLSQHYQPNFDNVAFHEKHPWFLFEGKAVSLDKIHPLTKIDYSGDIKLLDFHPEKTWAAGVCAEKYICIADLKQGQVIFHLRLPPVFNSLEEVPQQVRFSKDGKKLFYVIGGRTIVVHDLMISKI